MEPQKLATKSEKETYGKGNKLKYYILEPFLEHKFEPLGWMDVLAILTICTNDMSPTLFCDEDGYKVVPMQMVNVLDP